MTFDRSITEPAKMTRMLEAAKECLALDGEFWECGVFRGGSARELAALCRPTGRILRLFDSFEGLSEPSQYDTGPECKKGHFSEADSTMSAVMEFVNYGRAAYHMGWIPESFHSLDGMPSYTLENTSIAFAYIDLDLYQPTFDALHFIWPRIVPHGIVVIDDYGHPDWPGVKRAVDEFWPTATLGILESWPDWQAIVRKR